MEGDETEVPLLGKLDACSPLPIWMGCQDEDLCFVGEVIEGDGDGVLHHSIEQRGECREKHKRKKKKRYPLSPKPEVQPWQAQGYELLHVVNAGSRPANQN